MLLDKWSSDSTNAEIPISSLRDPMMYLGEELWMLRKLPQTMNNNPLEDLTLSRLTCVQIFPHIRIGISEPEASGFPKTT